MGTGRRDGWGQGGGMGGDREEGWVGTGIRDGWGQ